MDQEAEDGRGDRGVVVLARPPVVYLVSILVGFGLNAIWPVEAFPRALGRFGLLLVLLAVALFALAVREFRRARTPIRTRKPVTAVVRTGPYRLSRKPHLSVVHAAATRPRDVGEQRLGVGMLVPTLVLMSYGVIAREERYMAQKFGEEYLRYTAAVRRWI